MTNKTHHLPLIPPLCHQNFPRLTKRLGCRLCPDFVKMMGPTQPNQTPAMLSINISSQLRKEQNIFVLCNLRSLNLRDQWTISNTSMKKHPVKGKFGVNVLKFIMCDCMSRGKRESGGLTNQNSSTAPALAQGGEHGSGGHPLSRRAPFQQPKRWLRYITSPPLLRSYTSTHGIHASLQGSTATSVTELPRPVQHQANN